jgi:hypothetical protein
MLFKKMVGFLYVVNAHLLDNVGGLDPELLGVGLKHKSKRWRMTTSLELRSALPEE